MRKRTEWSGAGKLCPTISGAILLIATAGAGCGAEGQEPTDDEKRPGAGGALKVVEMDEAAGKLVMTFARYGRQIRYELRLGPPMKAPPLPEDLAINPELPTYEVDARVLDASGQAFHLQTGGDAFLDSSWEMPRAMGFDEIGRLKDIRLMKEAIPAIRRLQLPPALAQLRLAALEIGRSVEDAATKPGVELPPPPRLDEVTASLQPDGGALQQAQVLAVGPSSVRKWDFVVRKKCFPICAAGNHSAVFLRGWSASNSIVFRAYSCNHGTCASDTSVMRDHCTMPGFRADDGTHTRYFYRDGCTSRYNVTSVWGHNCNDDSELQGRAIWHDRPQNTSGGQCNNRLFHDFAPGCTY